MSAPTKQKILEAAARCFNRSGVANTRLQHIADEAGMSVGNMAYHFRTKEIIVGAIWEEIEARQKTLMAEFRVLPLFEDIERHLREEFALQQAYRFFYQDTLDLLRTFPEIATAHRMHWHWQTQQIGFMIVFNVSRGAFLSELFPGHHEALAAQYWAAAETWLYLRVMQGKDPGDFDDFRNSQWKILQPVFSDMGRHEFSQLNALILGNYF
jgi:AcrR family transcriptional regulator